MNALDERELTCLQKSLILKDSSKSVEALNTVQ